MYSHNVGYDEPYLPADLVNAVRNVLSQHIGRSRAIARTDLLRQVNMRVKTSDRQVRQVINHLRKTGHLILSTGGVDGGYWMAASAQEAEDYIVAELLSRASDLQQQAQAMRTEIARQFRTRPLQERLL